MDAFSEVLGGVRLRGAVFFRAAFTAPWDLPVPHSSALAQTLAPGSRHLVLYHFLVDGPLRARVADAPSWVSLSAGDIVVFPHGHAHELSGGSGGRGVDPRAVMEKVRSGDLSPLETGGGGERTQLVCGYLACDPLRCGPILESLPPMLHVNVRSDDAGRWLEQSILHVANEAIAQRPGTDAMLVRLSEALFVDTLRRYVAGLPDSSTGWLAGARDPAVGRALTLMHSRSHHPWTIGGLAEEAGLSRSVLVERFTKYVGEPPMTYLTSWRLRLAAEALETTSKGVAEIAANVGYESEAAFNRAFKRMFELPPARFRRERRESACSPPSRLPPAASR